jgi:hypothetical protein
MYAGDDHLVGRRQLLRRHGAARGRGGACFDGLYHDLNEVAARPVYDCLRQWLSAVLNAESWGCAAHRQPTKCSSDH